MTSGLRIQLSTNPGRGLTIERVTPKLTRLVTPDKSQIIFWMSLPYAVHDGAYMYVLNDTGPARLGLLTKFWPDEPRINLAINDFEYSLGQVLSKAGLHLVRRLD